MILVSIQTISQTQYRKLIEHIFSCCDEISFQFPGVTDDGQPLPDPDWKEYHEKSKPFLQLCFQNNAKQSYSRHYQGMKLGTYGRIIHVKPFPQLKELLLAHHVFDWLMQNDLPEDVCFHAQKKLRFFTCSHDEEFLIYNETKKDVEFLKKNAFDYRCIE